MRPGPARGWAGPGPGAVAERAPVQQSLRGLLFTRRVLNLAQFLPVSINLPSSMFPWCVVCSGSYRENVLVNQSRVFMDPCRQHHELAATIPYEICHTEKGSTGGRATQGAPHSR